MHKRLSYFDSKFCSGVGGTKVNIIRHNKWIVLLDGVEQSHHYASDFQP